jgi:hypothetical protein
MMSGTAGSPVALQSWVRTEAPDASVGDAIGAAGRLVIGYRPGYCPGAFGSARNRSTRLFASQINGFSGPIEAKMHDFASAVHWLYLRCGI